MADRDEQTNNHT